MVHGLALAQSQEGDWTRDPICESLHDMGLDLSRNGSAETMYDQEV